MFGGFGRSSQPEHMLKMLRESEPNAFKRMMKFLEDYDKCTPVQRDQVFVPENEEGIIRLFVGSLAVFKKHHSKSKAVAPKDVGQSLKLLDLLRERSPRALGSRWEAIRVHIEAFLDEALPLDIKQTTFFLLFSILDTSILPEPKRSEFSSIEDLFCKSFHWPNSYRLRVEPAQPCEFLPRTNQLTESWDTFSLLFRSFVDMCLDSRTNHEVLWWHYIKEKILNRFPLSVSERVAGAPLSCPVIVAECLVHFLYCCLVEKNIPSILGTTKDLEIALSLFNVVMMSVQSTTQSMTLARKECVALLERWVDIPNVSGPKIRPQPFEDDLERWSLLAVRCIVMFFQNWKDVKGFKNEQDLDTAIKCITVIELVSRLDINPDGWKSLFRSILEISNFYLGVTDEQRRGEATHPPDKALSCFITDGVFALLLRRVSPPEFWEDLCHRERGITSILHLHTTVDSWTRVLLVVARRLVIHISPSQQNGTVPLYLNDNDFLSLRVGTRQKGLLQASPWQHRVEQHVDAPTSSIDQQLQPFFSVGSPWFSPIVWSKNTDCCRAWDRLISLIPPKKKVDRDFSISMQALDAICEWFLEAGVLPSTCMQYVIAWLRAAFEHSGDPIPPSAPGSAPAHIEVVLSVAIRMFMRIVMHTKYPISHEDPLMLPLISVLHKMAFKCESVCIQMEAFQALTQFLHVIPHAISFLVPSALESMLFTKRFPQSLTTGHHVLLCQFIASVVHLPGYVITNGISERNDIWTNFLSALREMLQYPQDSELYSQLMWCCWLALLDASTSSNNAFGGLFLSELSSAMDRFPHSSSHLNVTLEVIRATAVLIPSFINYQQHCINQILIQLAQGLSSKINQSSITKSSEPSKIEYFHTVNSYILAIREWLVYCVYCVPPEVLDQVYASLIFCVFEGTNIYQNLQSAMAVQPTDWSEVDRIIASRNVTDSARSEISIAAEICMSSLSNFMPTLPSVSLTQVTCDYAASLCKAHPHISLLMGSSRILTFVEDQSAWGKVWVIVRDTTGIRLWSAHSVSGDSDSVSPAVSTQSQSQGGGVTAKKKRDSDSKDPLEAEVLSVDLSHSTRDSVAINDDEVLTGVSLLNDEDFVRPSGKLAHFQPNPHTSRVEMLGHLMDFLNESISSSSVALNGSNVVSSRLIQLRSQEHLKLSANLKQMMKEEQAKAAEWKASKSAPFATTYAPPIADKRLWKLQFTRQVLSSFMFASCFVSSPCTRILSPADEIKAFQDFDSIPSRDNSSVMLALPPAGSSPDADAFLGSLLVHSVRISDSEFFLSTPDRDIRFICSSSSPPPPQGRWTSPAHVQFLWHPRDGGPFDPSTSCILSSCYCIVLQPIGANLIRVENVLMPDDGISPPVPSPKSIVPFLRGCIVNVNIIEPVVLASVTILMSCGADVNPSRVFTGTRVPTLLQRRFDVLFDIFVKQTAEAPQNYFDVVDLIHKQ